MDQETRKAYERSADRDALMEANITHDIGWAIKMLKHHDLVTRAGWNKKGMVLGLQVPDDNSANTEPYIFLLIPDPEVEGKYFRVPWTCSQTDILAHDWDVVL